MSDLSPEQRFDRRLRQIVKATKSSVPEADRLARLLADFRTLHGTHRGTISWPQRIAEWFSLPHLLPAPAIAFAAVLIVVQGIGLFMLAPGPERDLYRGATAKCENAPRIRVVFKPDAPQAEIVILLRKVEGSVAAGPSETGELWIRIPEGRSVDEAVAQVRSSAIVDEAIVVPPAIRECRE